MEGRRLLPQQRWARYGLHTGFACRDCRNSAALVTAYILVLLAVIAVTALHSLRPAEQLP